MSFSNQGCNHCVKQDLDIVHHYTLQIKSNIQFDTNVTKLHKEALVLFIRANETACWGQRSGRESQVKEHIPTKSRSNLTTPINKFVTCQAQYHSVK